LLKGENELLKGELLKGRLLKGKELLKKNWQRGIAKARENMGQCKSAPRTLYISFRKAKLKTS
jgi:hypothetical protein